MSESAEQRPHPGLRTRRDGARLTVTLADPGRRNAQTPGLWAALATLAQTLDPQVRVVVLDAEGPSFSAGLDRRLLTPEGLPGETSIVALAGRGSTAVVAAIAGFQRGFAAWGETGAIVVAAVQGHAIGAGLQLALAADLRIVADDAQLAMRETALGLVPDLGGTGPLVHLVGYARALELCATGRTMGAREAVATGLATAAVPEAELAAATDDLVAALLAAPEPAVRELKALLRKAVSSDREDQLRHERTAQARLLTAMAAAGGNR